MEELATRSKQRKIRALGGLFFALLIVLTLGGNTIRALSMPKVITAVPTVGSLDYSYEGTALVRPAAERKLMNPAGWKVLKVLVKVGDKVHKGQPLVRYDDSDVKDQLADQQSSLKKMQLSLEQLEYDLKQALREGDEEAVHHASSALKSMQFDMEDQKRRITKLQEEIQAGRELIAPVDGIVMMVGAEEGIASAGVPDVSLSDTSQGYQIWLMVPDELAILIRSGEELDSITLVDDDARQLTGTVTTIEEAYDGGGDSIGDDQLGPGDSGQASAANTRITISLKEEESGLLGGERVKVSLRKSKGDQLLLVPNEAVHHDSQGAFLYTISAEQGPLGNAYYAKLTRVETEGSNEYATAVSGEIFEQSEVIVGSTGLIMDGTRVRYELN
ncbi:efflux RND transporter periplasmic adaptor subunit [Paenibacillus barengoltzii]|uniref:Multidrug efflux pump subunit AcrA (Membrane-fusion protein) n=1 Tax=Paenibacillus barengoltzii J12 TaxID=935846 RepID=A0ABY1M434_9BACL|nr:biotin/lipoyl-binding protein [Paenibacillus barengoltzii]SMF53998.1 Multidrug efflux pump subunit AcrA (membrane-fusion protein) [Paenibacillus barengoltzii J12]